MLHGEPKRGMNKRAVVEAAMIFHPSVMGGVLVEVFQTDLRIVSNRN
jgi:hypothetical protein